MASHLSVTSSVDPLESELSTLVDEACRLTVFISRAHLASKRKEPLKILRALRDARESMQQVHEGTAGLLWAINKTVQTSTRRHPRLSRSQPRALTAPSARSP